MKHSLVIFGTVLALSASFANAAFIYGRCDGCNVTIQDDVATREAAVMIASANSSIAVGDKIRVKNLGGTLLCEGLLKQDFIVLTVPVTQDSQLSDGVNTSPCEPGYVTPAADKTGWSFLGFVFGGAFEVDLVRWIHQ